VLDADIDDILLRLGREAFLSVMTGAPPEEAHDAAERVPSAVADKPCRLDSLALRAAVTIGVADTACEESLDEAIAWVDKAFWRAESAGRNMVMAA
jgi:PleD family two-component response regulator